MRGEANEGAQVGGTQAISDSDIPLGLDGDFEWNSDIKGVVDCMGRRRLLAAREATVVWQTDLL